MRVVGVRELKAHLSEALDAVEAGEVIEVTNHGRSVARLVPINRRPSPQEIEEGLASVDRLAEEIGKYVSEGVTAEQIINDIRS
jgi:prevent-host-death family protein